MSQRQEPSWSSASILQAAVTCQPQGWARLCACYGPVVYRWARAASLQDSDAQDVGQEVFAVVAKKLAQFRRECPTTPFRAWLWGITRNKLREFRRDREAAPVACGGSTAAELLREAAADRLDDAALDAGGSAEFPTGSSGDEAACQRLVLQNALALLREEIEPQTWQIFWRTTVDLTPAAEVAREMGLQPAAARQARYRVLRRLRLLLADTGEFGEFS
ncbi:MAG: sigma-70 family RNA polymerase sigma factor [Pirellulales bacterium]